MPSADAVPVPFVIGYALACWLYVCPLTKTGVRASFRRLFALERCNECLREFTRNGRLRLRLDGGQYEPDFAACRRLGNHELTDRFEQVLNGNIVDVEALFEFI